MARTTLTAAYAELVAASKVAVGDDGRLLLGAAAAVDVAVEALTPPDTDTVLALNSAGEAHELANGTRVYAQGGNIAKLLDPAKKKIADALKLLQP